MTVAQAPTEIEPARIARIVSEVLRARVGAQSQEGSSPLVVNISVRHVHVTQEHLETLFGAGAELTPMRWLYQEGAFSSEQAVDLIGPKRRMLHDVRILGPTRPATQIELAFSDAIMLGIDVPVRMSGNIAGTPGCIMMGPKGHIVLDEGVIRAQRHVHMSPTEAERHGVSAGDEMDLVIEHPACPVTLGGVKVRIAPGFKLAAPIDSDEGNACDLPGATGMQLVKSACRQPA